VLALSAAGQLQHWLSKQLINHRGIALILQPACPPSSTWLCSPCPYSAAWPSAGRLHAPAQTPPMHVTGSLVYARRRRRPSHGGGEAVASAMYATSCCARPAGRVLARHAAGLARAQPVRQQLQHVLGPVPVVGRLASGLQPDVRPRLPRRLLRLALLQLRHAGYLRARLRCGTAPPPVLTQATLPPANA